MKLHLPKMLRCAVLTCITSVAGITTTVGTASFTGGVVAFALSSQQAVGDVAINANQTWESDATESDLGQITVSGSGTVLTIAGGEHTSTGKLELKQGAKLTMTGGELNISQIQLHNHASYSQETLLLQGGTINVSSDVTDVSNSAAVLLGHWPGGTPNGTLRVENNGKLNVYDGAIVIGWDSKGLLDISGGTVNAKKVVLNGNRQGGELLLNGGRLNVDSDGISVAGAGGERTANFLAGTLGALSAEGWTLNTTNMACTLGNITIDTNVVGGQAGTEIKLLGKASAAEGGSSITLAGSGSFVIDSTLNADVLMAEGSTAKLKLVSLDGFVGVSNSGGYGSTGASGFLDAYKVVGEGSTVTQVYVGDSADPVELTNGLYAVDSVDTTFVVSDEVTFEQAAMEAVTSFVLYDGGSLKIDDTAVLDKIVVVGDTASVVLEKADETITGNAASNYTGNLIIASGTTVYVSAVNSLGVDHVANRNRTITVQGGATLEVGNDTYYKVILEEGATMANKSGVKSTGSKQNPYIELAGNATIHAQDTFGMRYGGSDSVGRETMNLNGHTLTKTGAGEFFFFNTTINAGTIDVKEGLLNVVGGTGFANVDVRLQSGAKLAASVNDKGWKTLTLYSGEENSGAAEVHTNGSNLLTIHNGIRADVLLDKKGGGNLTVNGGATLAAGATITAGTLTLNGAVTLGSVLTINSGATLTMGGDSSVTITSLGAFESSFSESEMPDTNGVSDYTYDYKIVDNQNEGNANTNLSSVTYNGSAYELNDEGCITLSGRIYYAVEAGEDNVVNVGGESPTTGTSEVTEFYVGEDGTLNILGAASSNVTVERILQSTKGSGNILLGTNATLLDGDVLLFEGSLSIESGATLTLGTNSGGNQSIYSVNISSLESLDLNGGTLQMYYVAPTIQNMNVIQDSTLSVDDIKEIGLSTKIGRLNLDANLQVNTSWKSDINIGVLTGEGDLTLKQDAEDERNSSPFTIDALDNYAGKITVSGEGGHKVTLSVNVSEGQTLNREQIELAGANAVATIKGSGTYNLGSSLTLDSNVSLAENWTGTVTTSNAVVSGDVDATELIGNNSSLDINGLTMEAGSSLTLGGKVTLGGQVVVADTIVCDGALTFGEGFKLSVTQDMLVKGPGEDELVINLLSGASASAVAGMDTSMLSDALLQRGEPDTWQFNADGTIVFVDAFAVAKLVWAGGDGVLTGANFEDGGVFVDDCEVTYGAVTDGDTDTVTIDTEAHVRRFIVEAGGDYVFTGDGALIMKDGLIIESGAKVTVDLADGVSVRKQLTSAGELKVSKVTGEGDVNITGGSIELAGENALANTGEKNISNAELKGTWTATGVTLGTSVVVGESADVTLSNTTLTGTVTNNGILGLAGSISLSSSADYQTQVSGVQYSDGLNGLKYADVTYTIVEGEGTTNIAADATWLIDGVAKGEYANGKLNVLGDQQGTLYWVNAGTVNYGAEGLAGTGIALKGGTLVLNASLSEAAVDGISMQGNGTVEVSEGVTLKAEQVHGATIVTKLSLAGSGTYDVGAEKSLGYGVDLSDAWTGVVSTSAADSLQQGGKLDLSALGNENSTIALKNSLTLGTEESVATLMAGQSTLALDGTLTYGNLSSAISAGSLELGDSFAFSLGNLLESAREIDGNMLISLSNSLSAADKAKFETVLNGAGKGGLYDYKTTWEGNKLVLTGVANSIIWEGENSDADSGSSEQLWNGSTTTASDSVAFTGNCTGDVGTIKVQGDAEVGDIKVTNIEEGKDDVSYVIVGDSINSSGNLIVGTEDGKGQLVISNSSAFAGDAVVTEDSKLTISSTVDEAGRVNNANLQVDGTLEVKGELVIGSTAGLSAGSLVAEKLTISGTLQNAADALVRVGELLGDLVIDLEDDTTIANITAGTYNLMEILGEAASVQLTEDDRQSILAKGYTYSELVGRGSSSTYSLRRDVAPTTISLEVREMTDAELVWNTNSSQSMGGLIIGTLTNGTMTLKDNSILDSIKSVNVVKDLTLDLNSDDTDVVNIKGLTGSGDLSIKGNGDSVNVSAAKYAGNLSLDTVQANLNVANANIIVQGEEVVLSGSMSKGTLVLSEGAAVKGDLVVNGTDINVVVGTTEGTVMEAGAGSTIIADLGQISGSTGDITVGDYGKDGDFKQSTLYAKYFGTYSLEGGKIVADRNTSYYTDKAGTNVSANGAAGLAMADAALVALNPQMDKTSDLGAVLNVLDTASSSEADELGASLAGASTAVLGMAAMGDLERQLKAIRNRTTIMGVDQSVANDEMPYVNAWINAEGNRSELTENNDASGYELNSWGGTVGFDVDFCSTLTAGMALTAMYGDLNTTGSDAATGSLDSQYVSVFARYVPSAWTHTFVATIGKSDINLDRTVNGTQLKGATDGMSFGFMYEVGRVIALGEEETTCLQPVFNVTWRHSSVNGYTEDGGDLALEVGEQTMDTVTLGVGARLQSVVGESLYNRTSILEARVLAKADLGDCTGSSDVALTALPGAGFSVESAEMGAIGLEAGIGLTIPMGQDGGSVFMDASVEVRSDYMDVNGTVGYRVNF